MRTSFVFTFIAIALFIVCVLFFSCVAGCSTAPVGRPASPAGEIASAGTTAGELATGATQQAGRLAVVVPAIQQPQRETVIGVRDWLTDAAGRLSGIVSGLAASGAKLDAMQRAYDSQVARLTHDRDEARTEAATQRKRADDAAESAMLARAGWFGVGILAGLTVAWLGVWVRNWYVIVGGAATAVVAFGGVVLFLALAWVAQHLALVVLISLLVLAGAGVLIWLAIRNKWLTYPTLNSGAKLLGEALAQTDPAQAMGLVRQAVAALRTDTDFAASWRKMIP